MRAALLLRVRRADAVGLFDVAAIVADAAALREVAEFLAGQTLEVDVETVNFSLTFPRYVYTSACLPSAQCPVPIFPVTLSHVGRCKWNGC